MTINPELVQQAHAAGEHAFCGPECDTEPTGAQQDAESPLVHVGWWCWRGTGHGHLATTACRSDNVPLHVPAEWADEMRAVLQRVEDDVDPDEAALRDRIAHALEREDAERWGYDHGFADRYGADTETNGFVDAVLTAFQEHLDIGDAEAWCKVCRRAWEGPRHVCESDAERRLGRVREMHQKTCLLAVGKVRPGAFACGVCEVLDQPAALPAPDRASVLTEAADDDGRRVYAWAQAIDTADGGRTVHLPGTHRGGHGPETAAIVVSREDVPTLRAMLADVETQPGKDTEVADAVLGALPSPAEDHRLALCDALRLGSDTPWEAVLDRVTELGLPPLDQDPVARRLGLLPSPADRTAVTAPAEPFPIWTVWREEQPAYGHFATEDTAKHASINCWEEDEPVCPDYSWRPDGGPGNWELLVGDERAEVYIRRHLVWGGLPQPPRAAVLTEAAEHLEALDPVEAALAGQHAWRDAAAELRRLAGEAAPDNTEALCSPQCSEQHTYRGGCALKPPPVDPRRILGIDPGFTGDSEERSRG